MFSHLIFASTGVPAFVQEIAILLIVSAGIAYLCYRFGLVPIVGFLIAGVIIGPNALALVRNQELIDATAEVGVILLLFTIGIEFSLEKLASIRRLIFGGGGLQVGLTIGVAAIILMLFGVDWRTGIYTGCLIALSSTAIVMKLLTDRHEMDTPVGQIALGILIFQDLAVVVMVLVVPMLGSSTGDGGSGLDIVLALGKAIGIIVVVLVLARRLVPRMLEAVARTCSQEIFLLTIVGISLGTAFLTSLAGVSLALGAFLAGLLVSESRFRHHAYGEILPLQILFSASFFVSVGMLLDLGFLIQNLPLVLGGVLLIVVVKAIMTGASVLAFGYRLPDAAAAGLLLSQIGEFSFVLERTGREYGLFPAGMEAIGTQTFVSTATVLLVLTPFLSDIGNALRRRLFRTPDATDDVVIEAADEPGAPVHHETGANLDRHVILAGYGSFAQTLAPALHRADIPYLILTLSPGGAQRAELDGLHVLRGDYARRHTLELAGIWRARTLVVADDEPEMTHRVVALTRGLNPDLTIIARTPLPERISHILDAGADHVITDQRESAAMVLADLLEQFEIPHDLIIRHTDELRQRPARDGNVRSSSRLTIRLGEEELHTTVCSHLDQIEPEIEIAGLVCAECLAMGDTWVHLRACMTCGNVGCCDSSKNKHASRHFAERGHPIMKSLEPGDDWSWCYIDKKTL